MQSYRFAILVVAIISALVVVLFYLFFSDSLAGQEKVSLEPLEQNQNQSFIMPLSQPNYLPIRDFNIPEPILQTRAAGLYDIESSRFLFSKDIDKLLPIASITKLMTAVVILEQLGLNDILTVIAEDINVDGSGADLFKNERIASRELIKIMLIKSSNDAALTFASFAKTKNKDLVALMNNKAKELHMTQTQFSDPAGLNDNGFSTVRDITYLVRYISEHYPEIWEILRIKNDTIRAEDGTAHEVTNTNQLLGIIPEIIGGKTGYTNRALGTMSLVVKAPNNDKLVAIVLGSNDRFGEIKQLIDWAKLAYRWK